MKTIEKERTAENEKKVNTPKRVLVYQDNDGIASIKTIKAKAKNVADKLNLVNEVYPIESHTEIPGNIDNYIFQKMLERDPLLKQLNDAIGVRFDQLKNIPANLLDLKSRVLDWQNTNKDGLQFVIKTKDGFTIDEKKVDDYIETTCETNCRRYLTDPDHIAKFEFALSYVEFVNKLNVASKLMWQIPITRFNNMYADGKFLYPEINLNFCCDTEVVYR